MRLATLLILLMAATTALATDLGTTVSAKPVREKKIDPDNPFAAALMGLKNKG